MVNKVDSNITGLRIAEESTTLGTLPGTPVWMPMEPNGYNDFGGKLTTVARNPINPSRQRQKGVTTDLEASGGFGCDFTPKTLTKLIQGFLFADIREKLSNIPVNGSAIAITGAVASTKTINIASTGASYILNDLLLASDFDQTGNNGLKSVASSTGTTVVVVETMVDETSTGTPKIQKVGHQFASATLDVVVSGSYPRLTRASGAKDFTTFGLIPGEWVFIGGDSAGLKFTNAVNNGFCRVRAVAASYIELDKTTSTMVAETGTGKTIQLFFGNVIKNESDYNLIKRRSYQLERQLGNDGSGTMSEYLVGAVPGELSIQIRQADKITCDMTFVATDNEQRDGATGLKSGTRPSQVITPAYNSSNDFSRIKMHLTDGGVNATPLFGYFTELTLTINNNLEANKAVAVLGAFDVSAGTFAVSGSLQAYFATVAAAQAVRNNSDVSIDFALAKQNSGVVFDIPLIALGDASLKVEADKPIMLPLSMEAAEGSNHHTILYNEFPYLPTAAE